MRILLKIPNIKTIQLLLLLGFCLSSSGQNFHQNESDLIEKGDRYFTRGQYADAEVTYEQLYEVNPASSDIIRRLGVVKVLNSKYLEAINILELLPNNSDSIDHFVVLQLAKAYHQTNNFKRANEMYQVASADSTLINECEIGIKQTEFAMQLQKIQSGNVVVNRLDTVLNSLDHELAPRLLNDTILIYRKEIPGSNFAFPLFESKLDDLRYAYLRDNESPLPGTFEILSKTQISRKSSWNQMDVSVGGNMYMYHALNEGKIGISNHSMKEKEFGSKTRIPFLDPDAASVAILPERNMAYYIKTIDEDGVMQSDIFYAEKDSTGNWIEKGKLEVPFNSAHNEDFLYWCEEESALYFSSDRINGSIGGFDVFRSDMNKQGVLQEPLNIGFPVNTPSDDIYFTKKDSVAFYASYNGKYRFDLYSAVFQKSILQTPSKPWYEKYGELPGIERIENWRSCEHFYFETYQNIPDTSSKAYKMLRNALLQIPDLKVRLTGYADWTGHTKMNQKISYERVSNLFFALCMDGVKTEQIKLDFKGSTEPRTATKFIDKESLRLAKAANRCVTVEVVSWGEDYLFVSEKLNYKTLVINTRSEKFAVMVNVSGDQTDDEEVNFPEEIRKTHIENFVLYHTAPTDNLTIAAETFSQYKSKYQGSYLFLLK